EGGNAVVDVLFGDYNPGGKITMSFPYSVGQVPIHYNHFKTGRPSEIAGAFYKCSYLDSPHWAMLPFGYGLSYTEFQYSDLRISKNEMIKDKKDTILVSVKVKNIGLYKGEEVVQLYIQDEFGSRVRPVKELKGFKKISLSQNEEKEVVFIIDEDMLKFYTIENKIDSEIGRFKVFVGTNSSEKNSLEFELIK
ncbi:MAG: fibronectin type III-like domain-contianing protein, partial [Cetobacterium sp.]